MFFFRGDVIFQKFKMSGMAIFLSGFVFFLRSLGTTVSSVACRDDNRYTWYARGLHRGGLTPACNSAHARNDTGCILNCVRNPGRECDRLLSVPSTV